MNINNYTVRTIPKAMVCQREEKKGQQGINYCYNALESEQTSEQEASGGDKLHRRVREQDVARSIGKYI